jgi:hypothetical protein
MPSPLLATWSRPGRGRSLTSSSLNCSSTPRSLPLAVLVLPRCCTPQREAVRSRLTAVVSPLLFSCDLTSHYLWCTFWSVIRNLPPQRRLHLIDIENLVGCPRPTTAEASACREAYNEHATVGPDDLVVVACNHGAAFAVGLGWSGARLLLRSGPDGADLALLDVIAHESVEDRFAAIVVASGDGCFANAVARLGGLGLDVTVVSTGRALSRRLALAAKHVVLFEATLPPAIPAALSRAAA